MDVWEKFRTSSWGKEFIAGGFGGATGVVVGHPLDSLRIWQQQHIGTGSAFSILRRVIAGEGPGALYRGMGAPLSTIAFQNAIVFQSTAIISRAFDTNIQDSDPPSYTGVALGGIGAGAIQSIVISPVEQLKIRLQLQSNNIHLKTRQSGNYRGAAHLAKSIIQREGLRGISRGLTITLLRDAPSHGVYFWTYEYMREQLHQGCRKNGQEGFGIMVSAGGLAGVASWTCCYPLDVIKTRIQAWSNSSPPQYLGIVECFRKSFEKEGYSVLWRGLGTTLARAFVVNGAVFTAYETALTYMVHDKSKGK